MNDRVNPHPLTKYRPAFTASQLHTIVDLCRSEGVDDSPECKDIVKILVPLIAKIQVGAINPAYKLSEQAALNRFAQNQRAAYESGSMSPAEEAEYESSILGI